MKPSEKPIDRIDQFFKNKLDDHIIAPPENAWAKVEAGLSKKNNLVLWRWAAAILLMGALIAIIYRAQTKPKSQPVLAEKKIEKAKIESNSTATAQSKSLSEKIEATEAHSNTNIVAKKSLIKSIVQPIRITSDEIQKQEMVAVAESKQPIVEDAIEEKIKTEATPKATVASSQQKPIKLEFTLEDLPSVETVATTNEVKNTGLKKVLELARDMKQGEGPLTNLKEKKNELFAHNFITGKERTQ